VAGTVAAAGVAQDGAVVLAGVARLRPACSAYAFEFVCSRSTDIGANQCSRPAQRGENADATGEDGRLAKWIGKATIFWVPDQVAAMAISLPSRVTTLSQEPRD
jgi:hypothetical protein